MSMLEQTYKNATIRFQENLYLHNYISAVLILFFAISLSYDNAIGRSAAFGFAFLLMWLTSSFIFSKRNLIFAPQLRKLRLKAAGHLFLGNAPMIVFAALSLLQIYSH